MTWSPKWTMVPTTYTNKTQSWVVIVGADMGITQSNNAALLTVKDSAGNTIDVVYVAFTTSGESLQMLYRRILLPPGGVVSSANSTNLSIVTCVSSTGDVEESLKAALGFL